MVITQTAWKIQSLAKDNIIPFYDVVELGGKARKHKRVLGISLKEAKSPALSMEIIEKLERRSKKKFFWKERQKEIRSHRSN
ncbi:MULTISPECIES: hypothetical protein [Methanosarcina]|uniref:hypothetical protein n=1 Tax=Methanosarcina TaxID=2207 RepID=UPI000697FD8D|nr:MULTISPECIES: hypothetical protein [Methanosarcina]